MPNDSYTQRKEGARLFLTRLEQRLSSCLPKPSEMRDRIQNIVSKSKGDKLQKHINFPEAAFLKTCVIPEVFALMQTYEKIGKQEARQALLAEGHSKIPELCCGTPQRSQGHPFTKVFNASMPDILSKWQTSLKAGTQACPDFAIREPFPFKIVFEGKYFTTKQNPRTEIVSGIYQAFFYRALPYVPPRTPKLPAWDYEFSCLLAYDASEKGELLECWDQLATVVKEGFWEGANVFVMILGRSSVGRPHGLS